MNDTHIGAHINITTELAIAVGRIASVHRDGAIEINYCTDDPVETWHVTVVGLDEVHEYVVDDESGTIDPSPGPNRVLSLDENETRWLRNAMDRLGRTYDDPEPRTILSKLS